MKYDEKELYNKIKAETKIKMIIKSVAYIILLMAFVVNIILFFQNIFQKDGNKRIFDIYFFNIISRKYETKT